MGANAERIDGWEGRARPGLRRAAPGGGAVRSGGLRPITDIPSRSGRRDVAAGTVSETLRRVPAASGGPGDGTSSYRPPRIGVSRRGGPGRALVGWPPGSSGGTCGRGVREWLGAGRAGDLTMHRTRPSAVRSVGAGFGGESVGAWLREVARAAIVGRGRMPPALSPVFGSAGPRLNPRRHEGRPNLRAATRLFHCVLARKMPNGHAGTWPFYLATSTVYLLQRIYPN